jgi:hypothetical protein
LEAAVPVLLSLSDILLCDYLVSSTPIMNRLGSRLEDSISWASISGCDWSNSQTVSELHSHAGREIARQLYFPLFSHQVSRGLKVGYLILTDPPRYRSTPATMEDIMELEIWLNETFGSLDTGSSITELDPVTEDPVPDANFPLHALPAHDVAITDGDVLPTETSTENVPTVIDSGGEMALVKRRYAARPMDLY